LNEQLQSAYQLTWECLFSGGLSMRPELIRRLARLVAVRNGSEEVAALVEATMGQGAGSGDQAGGGPSGEETGEEREAVRFVEAWDAGRPLGDPEVAAMLQSYSPGEVVEMQLIAGFIGGQARLWRAVGGS
jgi:hypothetical protein